MAEAATPARYAIYYAPPVGSGLAQFGARWLGYDADAAKTVPQPVFPDIAPDRLRSITTEPRRYGFHATLKAPFALAEDTTEAILLDSVAALAAGTETFLAPRLMLRRLGRFLALTLSEASAEMQELADACVADLDCFRAPPSAAELERRRAAGLTSRQHELLDGWGYPYVMDQYRFHMTLTGRLDDADALSVSRVLGPLVEPYCGVPLRVGEIAVFLQRDREAPFRVLQRYRLTA